MNFANMSPPERMKASGLIGLIVVVLFFVVHTVLGAVAPKGAAAPSGSATGPVSPPATQPTVPPPTTTRNPPPAFPEPTMPQMTGSGTVVGGGKRLDPHDPFMPIRTDPNKVQAALPPKPRGDTSPPNITVVPEHISNVRPGSGGFDKGLPPIGNDPFKPKGSEAAPAPKEPEIRVIGVVAGEESVATVQVGGRVRICRPGDPLASGYRLVSINGEGIRVRHKGDVLDIRVGAAMNESQPARKESQDTSSPVESQPEPVALPEQAAQTAMVEPALLPTPPDPPNPPEEPIQPESPEQPK